MRYKITVTETVITTYLVEAATAAEAQQLASTLGWQLVDTVERLDRTTAVAPAVAVNGNTAVAPAEAVISHG